MYTVDYFIKKFEAIPENLWLSFDQGNWGGPCCALGHCRASSDNVSGDSTPEGEALQDLFYKNGLRVRNALFEMQYITPGGQFPAVAFINNGLVLEYAQRTPKQRILAALYDIKAMQSKDIDTGGKTKTVYVSVPVTITEQAKELVMS